MQAQRTLDGRLFLRLGFGGLVGMRIAFIDELGERLGDQAALVFQVRRVMTSRSGCVASQPSP